MLDKEEPVPDLVRAMGFIFPTGEEGDDVPARGGVEEMFSAGGPPATLAEFRSVPVNAMGGTLEVGDVLGNDAEVGRDAGFFEVVPVGVGGGVELGVSVPASAGSMIGELLVSDPCDDRSAFARSMISRMACTSPRIVAKP